MRGGLTQTVRGVICETGTPEEVFDHPQRQETRDFLARFRRS